MKRVSLKVRRACPFEGKEGKKKKEKAHALAFFFFIELSYATFH